MRRAWVVRLRTRLGLRQKIVLILVGLTTAIALLMGLLAYGTILRVGAGFQRSFGLEIPLSRLLVTLKEEIITRRDYLETFLLSRDAEELGPIVSRHGEISRRVAHYLADPALFLRPTVPAGAEGGPPLLRQWLRRVTFALPAPDYDARVHTLLEQARAVNANLDARARRLMRSHLQILLFQKEAERTHAGIRQFFSNDLRRISLEAGEEHDELSQVALLRGLESVVELSDPTFEAEIDSAISQAAERVRASRLRPQDRDQILGYLLTYREELTYLLCLYRDLFEHRATHDTLFRSVVQTGNELIALANQADEIATEAVLASFEDSQRVQQGSVLLIAGVWIGSLVLGLAVSVWTIRRMTRPLGELSEAARRMADGVYEGEVRAEGRDEIALLARTFNQMGRRIKEQIDALKRADALLIAQERLAAVGQLAAGIAHEVRNPLSAIKMNIQILSRKPTTAEADREYWEILIQEVNRLDRLVNDTLDYSQPAGLSRTWCDLRKILEESKEVVHQGGEPIRFVESHAMPLPRIYADERRIKQVLLNLLINACQALEGERRIGLFTDVVRREGREFVRVAIADAGSGILPEDLGRIFDPFFSRKAKGVGLGLAICKRIVEEHGGIIEARSGNGATDGLPEESVWVTVFRIWFPAAGGVGV